MKLVYNSEDIIYNRKFITSLLDIYIKKTIWRTKLKIGATKLFKNSKGGPRTRWLNTINENNAPNSPCVIYCSRLMEMFAH